MTSYVSHVRSPDLYVYTQCVSPYLRFVFLCVSVCVCLCVESDTLFVETEGGMGRKDQKIKERKRKGESGTTRLKLLAAHCSY